MKDVSHRALATQTVTAFLEWRFAKTRSLKHGAVEESVTAPNRSITIVASVSFVVLPTLTRLLTFHPACL